MRYSIRRLLSSFSVESAKQAAILSKNVVVGSFKKLEDSGILPPEKRPELFAVREQRSDVPLKDKFTVLSWNIWRGYNKEQILKGLRELIAAYQLDVIFLQEVPVFADHAFWEHELFKEYNLFYVPLHHPYKYTVYFNFKHSGNLVLVKAKWLDTKIITLPITLKNALGKGHHLQRIDSYVRLSAHGKNIGLHCVHMECMTNQKGRLLQVKHILKEMPQDDIVILGGDMNTFHWSELSFKELKRAGFRQAFEELRLRPRLDHFFVRGANFTAKALKNKGSDHYPILVTIDL